MRDRVIRGLSVPLQWSLAFLARHPAIIGLALISALGRAMQFSPAFRSSSGAVWALEGVVESARLAIALIVIGGGSLSSGVTTARAMLTRRLRGGDSPRSTSQPERPARSLEIAVATAAFVVIAVAANTAVSAIANAPAVDAFVQGLGLGEHDTAAIANQVRFFLKNLTIIPFTLVWLGGLYHLATD